VKGSYHYNTTIHKYRQGFILYLIEKKFLHYHKILLIFGILFIWSVSFLKAQDRDGMEGNRITSLSISGLKRTRLSTAERYLQKFIGIEADKLDTNEVWAAIINTGILEPLSVEILAFEPGEQVLAVTVREKWSIFPLPLFMAGTGGISAGGVIYDANAFGLNDKLFLTGIYFSNGWLAAGGYMHASPGGRIPGWSAMASFSREKRHDNDQSDKVLRQFDLDTIAIRAGLNIYLLENSDLLSASVYGSYERKILRKPEEALNGPDQGLHMFSAGIGLSLNKNSWDGYFLSQEEASLRYTFNISHEGSRYQAIQFQGVWEKSLIPGFRFNMRIGLIFEPGVPILFESSPFAAQVAIFPRDFSARHYAGISAGLEKYLFQFSFGTISISAAYQAVYSRGSILGNSFDHGVTGMLSFYLSRLAIPAIGVGFAYNVKEHYLQASFNMGMSF
jgi:hypothetical protein